MMMKYSAVILLGGSSRRFNDGKINKVYLPINDKPLFIYSALAFIHDVDCEEVIIVYNKNDLDAQPQPRMLKSKWHREKRIDVSYS